MKSGLAIGARAQHRFAVAERHVVAALFAQEQAFPTMPRVFATAYMTGLFEWACVELIKPYYEDHEDSLGVHVDFAHTAPTLAGQTVVVDAELTAIEGRRLSFRVSAHDGVDEIGGGQHMRALIDKTRFAQKLAAKRVLAGLEVAS